MIATNLRLKKRLNSLSFSPSIDSEEAIDSLSKFLLLGQQPANLRRLRYIGNIRGMISNDINLL